MRDSTGASVREMCLWVAAGLLAAMVGFGVVRWVTRAGPEPSGGRAAILPERAPPAKAPVSPAGRRGDPARAAGSPGPVQPTSRGLPAAALGTDKEEAEDELPPDPASLPPRYHYRDPDEWQGMLVDLSMQAVCGTEDGCGLAMACRKGRCGPCEQDADCASGERCVLDHCVLSDNAGCSRRSDCGEDEMCILTGYSSDARGNSDMQAVCQPEAGGQWQPEEEPEPDGLPPAAPAPYEARDLLDEVQAYMEKP